MHSDCFILKAELIEVKDKPSYPIGIIGMDSFGNIPEIEDCGLMRRGILAIGKQDIILDNLFPLDDSYTIIGGSSDHLLVNLKKEYKVGDHLSFGINYPGLLQLMTSPYVKKKYF
jgi:predicted amino acid racemase